MNKAGFFVMGPAVLLIPTGTVCLAAKGAPPKDTGVAAASGYRAPADICSMAASRNRSSEVQGFCQNFAPVGSG